MKILYSRWGGKFFQLGKILKYINSISYENYVEPFFGSGVIYFNKDKRQNLNILNDLDEDIYKILYILKYDYDNLKKDCDKFLDMLKDYINCSNFEFKDMLINIINGKNVYFKNIICDLYYTKLNDFINGLFDNIYKKIDNFVLKILCNCACPMSDFYKFKFVDFYGFNSILNKIEDIKNNEFMLGNNDMIYNKDVNEIIDMYKNLNNCVWYFDPPYLDTDCKGYKHKNIDLNLFLKNMVSVKGKIVFSYSYNEFVVDFLKRNDFFIEVYDRSVMYANKSNRKIKEILAYRR